MSQPDVRRQMRIRQTDWGDAVRIDLNQLGAHLPARGIQGATWSEAASEALRDEWSESQNVALCDTMTEVAAGIGGGFDSFVEWTVLHNKRYDGTHMRNERRNRFRRGYRAAITTLGWAHSRTSLSTCIQAVGYVPKARATFHQAVWRPESLYDTEFMALAPAVVTRFGGGRQIHLSGVVAWDEGINPLFEGRPPNVRSATCLTSSRTYFRREAVRLSTSSVSVPSPIARRSRASSVQKLNAAGQAIHDLS